MGSLDTKDCTLLFRQKSDYVDLYENWDTLHLCMNLGARGRIQAERCVALSAGFFLLASGKIINYL